MFRAWDEDGSGTIDKQEFARAMRRLGLNVERPALDSLFDTFDEDHSGTIEYKELHKKLRGAYNLLTGPPKKPPTTGPPRRLVDGIDVMILRTRLKKNFAHFERLLVQWLASGWLGSSGSLAAEELSRVEELELEALRAKAALSASEDVIALLASARLAAEETLESKKAAKGKGPEPEGEEAALLVAQRAEQTAQGEVWRLQGELERAQATLRHARAEEAVRRQRQDAETVDGRLRALHEEATGRRLPCSVSHVLLEAEHRVATQPDLVHIEFNELMRALVELGVAHVTRDRRSVGILFAALRGQEVLASTKVLQVTGSVTLLAISELVQPEMTMHARASNGSAAVKPRPLSAHVVRHAARQDGALQPKQPTRPLSAW